MQMTILKIDGMHCDGCAGRVERVLERESGVHEAHVSHAQGEARVHHDDRVTTADRLREAVERAGYGARVAQ